MHDPLPSTTILTVAINRDPATVRAFASKAQDLLQWASGLCGTIEQRDG